MLWAELCAHKIHVLKPRPPELQNITIFGDRAFKEVTRLKWDL